MMLGLAAPAQHCSGDAAMPAHNPHLGTKEAVCRRRPSRRSSRTVSAEQALPPAAAQIIAQQAAVQRQALVAVAAVLPQQQPQHTGASSPPTHQQQQQQPAHLVPQQHAIQPQDTAQLALLPPSVLQQQDLQPLQQHQAPAGSSNGNSTSSGTAVDPTALHITDRVRLLTSTAAARRRSSKQRALPGGLPVNVLQYCTAAGISGAASQLVLQHVKATRISSTPESLGPYLVSYKRLVQAYGEGVVLEWLRKAPPIIRMEEEVPSRLAQLLVYLGPSASLSDVLALTKRCPQVLQVSRAVLVGRMMQLCSLLGRDPAAEAGVLLVAAPALLAMQPHTLQHKLQQLQCLAQTHPSWLEAYRSCPSKSLAVLLTYSLERQLRLHYAAAHHLQHTMQMNTIMALSKPNWLKVHPDFEDWCTRYKRHQQARQAAQETQQEAERHNYQSGGVDGPPHASQLMSQRADLD